MTYNIQKIPFSAYGSYFVISVHPKDGALYLRDIHGGDEAPSYLYRIELEGCNEIEILHEKTELRIYSKKEPKNYASFVVGTNGKTDMLYVCAEGVDLRFYAVGGSYDTLVPLSQMRYEHHLATKQLKIMFTCQQGTLMQEQHWTVRGSSDVILTAKAGSRIVLESYRTVPSEQPYRTYEEMKEEQRKSLQKWENSFPNPTGRFEDSRQLAAYITWMNFVHAEGRLTRDAMYMSKNWMYNIWSWDNCFAGIALSHAHPEKAYNQMKVFIDVQDESGCYPDYVNETFASYSFVKPPIHGWAFCKMMKQNAALRAPAVMKEMYESLVKMTEYWMKYRRHNEAVYPVYYHGNDSGWDNASVFHRGMPVESPNLSAFLIRQMDCLAEIASELERHQEAKKWKQLADEWYGGFLGRFFENGRLYAIETISQEKIREGNSLLMYLPLVIGYRFPKVLREKLVQQLLETFETPYGLATEAPDSPYYKKGGYWLGPVWAPTTYLMIDALRENGYVTEAKRLAEKFCRLTEIGLMSENYDPFTGEGYDDPAFSWPSCVLLQLLEEMNEENVYKN